MRRTVIALGMAVVALPQWALAEPSAERFVEVPAFPIEARGCYFRRGRTYCGRYCYVEINGLRYCQERKRDAVPQAGDDEFLPPPPEARRLK